MNDSRKLPPPSPANTAGAISDSEYRELEARLARSKFRSRFRLGDAELRCLAEHPDHVIAGQCRRFLQLRLAPADPPRDGRQTPMRGHPCKSGTTSRRGERSPKRNWTGSSPFSCAGSRRTAGSVTALPVRPTSFPKPDVRSAAASRA